MSVTRTRLDKATTLITENRIGFNAGTGELAVTSTSGLTYNVALRLGAEDSAWQCECEWGHAHSYEYGNECSHALAARFYAKDNDLTPADLGVTNPPADTDDDPWAGL